MATTADLIRTAAASAASGKAVDSNSLDPETSGSVSQAQSPDSTDEPTDVLRAENSTVEDGLPVSSEDTSEDSTETSDTKAEAPSEQPKQATQKTSDREVITVTDEKGRRRKVEIDWSNKEQIKKDLSLSYGARKWQAERDQAIARAKEQEKQIGNYALLEKAWAERGYEGVVDLLAGKEGSYRDQIRKQMEREKFLADASPEEVKALQEREAAEKLRREYEREREENKKFREEMTRKAEEAELKSVESKIHPVFHKYRFADKLGDATDEHMFDEMLWNTTLKRLEPYEEEGLELTPELIEKEFAAVSRSIRKRIGLQAEKKAARTVEQKKQEATENVQAKVMSGYKSGTLAEEARKELNSGTSKGLFKNFNKFAPLFRK